MKTHPNSTDRLVHHQHRWARNAWPLAIIAAGLGTTLAVDWTWHPSLAQVVHWGSLPQWWAGGVALTLVVALAMWFSRRHDLSGSATVLDEELDAKNRLETATVLQGDDSPLARAQRVETEDFIQRKHVSNSRATALVGLRTLVAILVMAHFVTLLCWARPWNSPANEAGSGVKLAALQKQEKPPVKPAEAAIPKASIEWVSPESEINATAIEEVPLKASASSTSGLRNLMLDVEVNGESRLKTPVAQDELKTPGKHTIETSIYLDQLAVQPFDIVSYSLRAQQIDDHNLPDTVSEIQFVEIKPLRQDVAICDCEGPSQCFNYIAAIKAAQLRLMKENHVLANSDLGKNNTEWKTDNKRVGDEQLQLADKTSDVATMLMTKNASFNIVSRVQEAQPFMTGAGKKIQATENQPALASQGRALALITEVEKYLKDKVSQAQSKVPKVADPFKKKQVDPKFKMTRAAQIALLAREQARLAGDLAHPELADAVPEQSTKPDPDKIEGTPGQRQTQICGRLDELVKNPALAPEVVDHLEKGRSQAQTSQQRIDEKNFPAALEPASEAARELRLASAAINNAGDKVAKNELADALRALNHASDLLRQAAQADSDEAARVQTAAAAKATDEAAQKLAEAALAQQENGSTNAAERMKAVAELMHSEALKKNLAQLQATPRDAAMLQAAAARLDALAERAAQARNQGPLSKAELARLVDRMERAQASLQRLASTSPKAGKTPGQNPGQNQGQNPGKGKGVTPANNSTPQAGGMASAPVVTSGGGRPPDSQAVPAPLQNGPVPPPSGTVESSSGRPLTPFAWTPEQRQLLALELLDELRENALDAMAVAPKAPELAQVRAILRQAGSDPSEGNVVALAGKINPPLEGLIKLLHTELARHDRQYQLADQEIAQAPPAYRPAVADYFERLSHDYSTNAVSAGGQK